MQLADVITSFRRHWRVSLGLVVLVAIALGVYLLVRSETLSPDRWEGSVRLLVPYRNEDGELPEGVPVQVMQGQEGLALSEATTEAAMNRSDLDESVRDNVEFDFAVTDLGDVQTLTVVAPTEELAGQLADNYALAYMQARQRRASAASEGQRDVAGRSAENLRGRLAEVESELADRAPDLLASLPDTSTGDDATSGAGGEEGTSIVDVPLSTPEDIQLLVYERQALIRALERARANYGRSSTESLIPDAYATVFDRSTPDEVTPEPPSPLIPIGAALGLALLLAFGAPVLLDRMDPTIRDARAVRNALAAPILSTIPAATSAERSALASPGSARAQAYQTLAAASVATDQLPRAIVVTAPVGDTQDNVAANFAAALADLGLRVALIGTQSRQSWYGDPPDGTPTLPDFLTAAHSGRLNGESSDHLVTTAIPNLRVLPAGDTEAEVLVDGLPPLLRSLADAGVDVTVIAGPSILEDPSATIMAWSTRSVLWVVETGAMTEQQATEAASRLELAGASPFGVALVQRNA